MYENVTKQADLHFNSYELPCNVENFTNLFLTAVPDAWMKFKVQIELFLGTLDGTNINPDVFEAGYINTFNSTEKINREKDSGTGYNSTDTTTGESSSHVENTSSSNGTSSNSSQSENYVQGVQSGIPLEVQNASGVNKTTGNGSTTGSETGSGNTTSNMENTGTSSGNSSTSEGENVTRTLDETRKETRINYYDNIAFLRERVEKLPGYKPFYELLEYCFATVTLKGGRW